MDTISSNNLIVAANEIPERTYFLQCLNTPIVIWIIRIVIVLIFIAFIGLFIYIKKQKKSGEQ